jgi:hypothetical protein
MAATEQTMTKSHDSVAKGDRQGAIGWDTEKPRL